MGLGRYTARRRVCKITLLFSHMPTCNRTSASHEWFIYECAADFDAFGFWCTLCDWAGTTRRNIFEVIKILRRYMNLFKRKSKNKTGLHRNNRSERQRTKGKNNKSSMNEKIQLTFKDNGQ